MFKLRNRVKKESEEEDSKTSPTSPLTFETIRFKERRLVFVSLVLLPILFLFQWFTSALFEIRLAIFVIAILSPLFVYFLLNPKIKKSDKKENIDEEGFPSYFDRLGHPRAVIRHNYFKQYLRAYAITLVILIAILVLMFTLSIEENKKLRDDYNAKFSEYTDRREQIASLKGPSLKEEVLKQINLLDFYYIQNMNHQLEINRIAKELNVNYDELVYSERIKIERDAADIVYAQTELQSKQNVINSFDNKTDLELTEFLEELNNNNKPYFSFRSQLFSFINENFLYNIAITPGLYFASLFLIHWIPSRKSDYYFQLSIGCILTYEQSPNFDLEQKRKHVQMCLEFYEQYLKKNFTKSIQQLDEMTSIAIMKSPRSLNNFSKYLLLSLKHKDKFTLLETLPNLIYNKKLQIILVHEPLSNRLKDWIPVLAMVVPLITTIALLI
ncbi:MAG: hypothetical protein ACW9W3_03280 [Candidatus Nitrosopumilus sp. bin_68KS]